MKTFSGTQKVKLHALLTEHLVITPFKVNGLG